MTSDSDFAREVERNYRHNALVNTLDGATFWFGMSFISTSTILPLYVTRFTDSKLAIGLLATLTSTGWLLPQIFTANWVQRLPRKKFAVVNLGLFTERLPLILMVPAAWLATRAPSAALILFFLLFAWHTIGAGAVAVGWQDMLAKVIPLDRRGKFFGITNFAGTAAGVAGAAVAAWFLDRYGFPRGYMWCFAAAATLVFISWVFLALTREPAQVSQASPVSQRAYLRRLPSVLRSDTNFRRYLLSRAIIATSTMASSFVIVYATQRWHLPDSQAGRFTASMLIGQAACNLLFGTLADRRGHKLVLEISTLLSTLSVGLTLLAPDPAWFHLVFALNGASFAGFYLSGMMITFEFATPDMRPTYIGLNNTAPGIASAVSPMVAGWLASQLGYPGLFAIAFAIGLVGLGGLHWAVHEPRQR